jgi:dephospho-CoA kinase
LRARLQRRQLIVTEFSLSRIEAVSTYEIAELKVGESILDNFVMIVDDLWLW